MDRAHWEILSVFAHYGLSKTSMRDLADAAGVSRQTLYNRFKTKEALLHWAVIGVNDASADLALAALKADGPPEARIVNFFAQWVGDHTAKIYGTPHGAEVFDAATKLKQGQPSEPDSTVRCRVALAQFLRNEGMTEAQAEDAVFTLRLAAKGLLLVVQDSEAFAQGMRKAVRATVSGTQNDLSTPPIA